MADDFSKYLMTSHFKSSEISGNAERREDKIQRKITQLETKIRRCQSQVESGNVKCNLLSRHSKKTCHLLSQIDKINERIKLKSEKQQKLLSSSVSKPTYFLRSTNLDDDSLLAQTPALESPAMRCVRETCEAISSYLDQEYSKSSGMITQGGTSSTVKDSIWTKVEDIAEHFSQEEVRQALLTNTDESAASLKDLTSRINLKNDANDLKFKFETGKLEDVSTKPILLQTVHQRMEEAQILHFERFLLCERALNEVAASQEKLNFTNEQIKKKLQEKYGSEFTQVLWQLLISQQQSQSQKALDFLHAEVKKMSELRKEKEEAVETLLTKYQRIQNFEKTVQSKQTMIQRLITQNASAETRYHEQCKDISAVMDQKILKLTEDVRMMSDQFQQLYAEEENKFLQVPLQNIQCLHNVGDQREPICDQSIHRFDAYYDQPGREVLSTTLENLNISLHVAPESVIPKLTEMKEEVYDFKVETQQHLTDGQLLAKVSRAAKGVHEKLAHGHVKSSQNFLPSVKESQDKLSTIMAGCIKFRKAAQIWWEQPAQNLVPWVTEENQNLDQYLHQFQNHADVLKKLQLVK